MCVVVKLCPAQRYVFLTCLRSLKSELLQVFASLLVLLTGVFLSTVTKSDLNIRGIIFAIMSATVSAWVTVSNSAIQREHGITSNQFLVNTLPKQTVAMLPVAPIVDFLMTKRILHKDIIMSRQALSTICVTCVLAVGVNVFTCFLIGKTSALTYQVVGHLKTIFIFVGGYVLFDHDVSKNVICGSAVALLGCVLYSVSKCVA